MLIDFDRKQNNTTRIRGASWATPMSNFNRARGLRGVGEDFDTANLITGINAELIFLQNQYRIAQGLPPLPASQSAPTVNVGLSPDTQKTILYGIGGIATILGFSALSRRKR